jgi:hypothetical protein
MKLSVLAFVAVLVTSSCVLLPPDNSFHAVLEDQSDSGQSCMIAQPSIFIDGGAAEVLVVEFKDSFEIIELTPEGDERTDDAVKWSRLSSTGSEVLVSLSRPGELAVGKIKNLTGGTVCITFFPALFASDEFSLQDFQPLSGAECCGLLTEEY